MCSFLPITLTEETLGRRHRQLNSLIEEAYKNGEPFQNVENLPEITPLDRLFKIELASKLKNVEYILKNIKDEDLLYVSTALKSKWLLDAQYRDIINPTFLEKELFPQMVTPAVGKFKNWLYINLKDTERCEEFYTFYAERKFTFGIKFLSNCSNIFILNESVKILHKLTSHQLKILCEKCPKVAEIYFQNIVTNDTIKDAVRDKSNEYFESLKVVLKREPDIFFDISEKYFENQFSKSQTKFIISHHKHRFNSKPELYTTQLLHIETLAQCLSVEECKDVVLNLARAKYLNHWFTFKNVEPLLKRLPASERSEFNKRVFVNRDIGDETEEWPYELPCLPVKENINLHVFTDRDPSPYSYECLEWRKTKKIPKRILKKKCRKSGICEATKTYLDLLFDEYRFMSFGKTLFELRRRIKAESSPQNREYILLVLVSKSGGRPENLATLLELLAEHSNEPIHVKAAIVRSLAKRAAVWRLPPETWATFLEFSQGLGLDGEDSECQCYEGLHAVVIRNLLETGNCEPKIRAAFMKQFSQLDEYKLNIKEKNILKTRLPVLILDVAEAETDSNRKALLLELLYKTLKAYRVPIETSLLINAVKILANENFSCAKNLLNHLYVNKIARGTLFRENFLLIHTDASYLNALKHDMSVLDVDTNLDLIEQNKLCPIMFLRKISIYFSEKGGLMQSYLEEMKKRALLSLNKNLAKLLCVLLGADITFISGLNIKEKETARFVAVFKANMHKGRPKLLLNEDNLRVIGAKAIANKVFVCPDTKIENYVNILLKWKRTVRISVILSQRLGIEADIFAVAATVRPTACLKTAIMYFRRTGDSFDIRVWDIVKPVLQNLDTTVKKRDHLFNLICNVNYIPSSIKVEYCICLYNCFINTLYYKALSILCHIELQFPDVSENFIENVLSEFLNEMNSDKYESKDIDCTLLYVRILVKYLMIAKDEVVHRERFAIFGEKLLSNLDFIEYKDPRRFKQIFDEMKSTLQNNKIFFENHSKSPLFVMEKIVSWMHKHFPVELHFDKYVHIHLTMLYFKAIRQSIMHMPHVFYDNREKITEGIDVVGEIFGKYIASEVNGLISQYFNSIIMIYKEHFCQYFCHYFTHDNTKTRFIVAIIKGIIKNSSGPELKIGIYLLTEELYQINDTVSTELLNDIRQSPNLQLESKFVAYAEFWS